MIFVEVVKEAGMSRHLNILPLSLSNFIFTFTFSLFAFRFFLDIGTLRRMVKYSLGVNSVQPTIPFDIGMAGVALVATHQVLLGTCYHCLSTSNVIK